METLLHPLTEKELNLLTTVVPHAIHITGPKGVGLKQIAREFSDRIGAEYRSIEAQESTVGVDQIRDLYGLTRGRKVKPQVLILSGESLSIQAQHAFLKLLEEPPTNTVFVITSHDTSSLLETVLSRMQLLTVRPLSQLQSSQLIDDRVPDIDQRQKSQLLFLSSGLPAELSRMLADPIYFNQKVVQMKQAQQYILSNRYGRLTLLHAHAKNRTELYGYIKTITRLLHHDVYQKKLISESHVDLLKRLERASSALISNGNLKLIAAQLVL